MIKKFWHHLNTTVGGGAVLIAFFSIVSKFLGLLRDRLFAGNFGAGQELDIFFAAFKIPDAIFNILILGALTSSFIPIFQKVWKKDASEGLYLASSVLNILLIAISVLMVIIWLAAPILTPLIVPGFSLEATTKTVAVTRILVASLFFFTFSNVMSGILNSWHKFFSFAISSVFYNLGIIVGILFFYPRFGLTGLAWGVVMGSSWHLLIQAFEAWHRGWRYKAVINFSAPVRRIFKLMIPRMFGLAGLQISWVFLTFMASLLPVGSLTIFTFAYNLQSFPVGVFGISLAAAAFPTIIGYVSEQNPTGLKKFLVRQISRMLFYLLPTAIFLLIMRAQVVRIILGTGSFDWNATILTANALGIFSFAIVSQGLIPLLSRAFDAHEDTKTPVIMSLISVVCNIILAIFLAKSYGLLGLTASFSIASILNLVLLIAALRIKIGDLNDSLFVTTVIRLVLTAFIAGIVTYGLLHVMSGLVNMRTFIGIFMQSAVAGLGGALTYLLIAYIGKFPELEFLRLKRK